MIQCGVFKGTTRAIFLDKREYTGPLWEQVDEAVKFVLRNIRLGCKLDGIYRQDIYELPPDSIRELVVNAVMNCSYLQASHIQVAIYDDRLEITSPGGLLSGVTIDLMKEGYSKIRNRALANAFVYMNLVEAWGSGIPKLMKAMKEYGLKEPEFIDMDVAFRINLYRGQDDLNDTNDSVYDPNDLNNSLNDPKFGPNDLNSEPNNPNNHESMVNKSNHETQLLTLIREEPELTYKQIGERLAISVSTVKRIITKLQKDGTVIRKGSKRKGKWLIQELQTKQ
jgi:predicted HTH transcriptional regulator